jgi:hypothetical protein
MARDPLDVATEFLHIAGSPTQIDPELMRTLAAETTELRQAPNEWDIGRIVAALSHLYSDEACSHVASACYVQYLAMREYARCDLHHDTTGGQIEVPVLREMQEFLWLSLAHWRRCYREDLIAAVGQYLESVHVMHTMAYSMILRSEFLMTCIWCGTASWASQHLSLYQSAQLINRDAISEVLRMGNMKGVSAIRLLAGMVDESWVEDLAWFAEEDGTVLHSGIPMYWPVSGMLDRPAEDEINTSLWRVFG